MTSGTTPGRADAAALAALLELAENGGARRYVECRFGFDVLCRLLEAGHVAIDDTSPQRAIVFLTTKGRALIPRR